VVGDLNSTDRARLGGADVDDDIAARKKIAAMVEGDPRRDACHPAAEVAQRIRSLPTRRAAERQRQHELAEPSRASKTFGTLSQIIVAIHLRVCCWRRGVSISVFYVRGIRGGAGRETLHEKKAIAQARFDDGRALAHTSFCSSSTTRSRIWPAPRRRGKMLVKTSLEYLNKLSVDAGKRSLAASRTVATAYAKVGDVQGNPNYSNLWRYNRRA